MKSHEVIREILKRTNVKQLADRMCLAEATVYHWIQPAGEDGHGAPNPLDRIKKLLDSTTNDAAIAQWICGQAGGFFVENSKTKAGEPGRLFPKASKTMKNFSELLATLNEVIEDGKVTQKESDQLRREWDKMKSVMESFVVSCERGEFGQPNS